MLLGGASSDDVERRCKRRTGWLADVLSGIESLNDGELRVLEQACGVAAGQLRAVYVELSRDRRDEIADSLRKKCRPAVPDDDGIDAASAGLEDKDSPIAAILGLVFRERSAAPGLPAAMFFGCCMLPLLPTIPRKDAGVASGLVVDCV